MMKAETKLELTLDNQVMLKIAYSTYRAELIKYWFESIDKTYWAERIQRVNDSERAISNLAWGLYVKTL